MKQEHATGPFAVQPRSGGGIIDTLRHTLHNTANTVTVAIAVCLSIVYLSGRAGHEIKRAFEVGGNRRVWRHFLCEAVRDGRIDAVLLEYTPRRLSYRRRLGLPPRVMRALVQIVPPKEHGVTRPFVVLLPTHRNPVAYTVSQRRRELKEYALKEARLHADEARETTVPGEHN